jgi:hypothetical protein
MAPHPGWHTVFGTAYVVIAPTWHRATEFVTGQAPCDDVSSGWCRPSRAAGKVTQCAECSLSSVGSNADNTCEIWLAADHSRLPLHSTQFEALDTSSLPGSAQLVMKRDMYLGQLHLTASQFAVYVIEYVICNVLEVI